MQNWRIVYRRGAALGLTFCRAATEALARQWFAAEHPDARIVSISAEAPTLAIQEVRYRRA